MKPVIRATIIFVSSTDSARSISVMQDAMAKCSFTGGAVWFTDSIPSFSQQIKVFPMRIDNREHYQRFVLHQLPVFADMLTTDHILIMQPDTAITNPSAWTDRFLEFDYIGAPWMDGQCGNGGFCLRSKRCLDAQFQLGWEIYKLRRDRRTAGVPYHEVNEDVVICDHLRHRFCDLGIRFADTETAKAFSTETWPLRFQTEGYKYEGSFGVHGWYTIRCLPNSIPLPA